MNKELIEMIDMPETIRGKILLYLAKHGESPVADIAAEFGCSNRKLTPTLNDIYKNSSYIELSKRTKFGVAHYTLVGLKCKMSESRSTKSPRYSMEPSNEIPYKMWRKVFGLMGGCHG